MCKLTCAHPQVLWCMDVVCHGLSLPIVEHETIKDCVNVYCDWLSALLPVPNVTVPRPIVEDANLYARKIINHFHNLFVPRSGEGNDTRPVQTHFAELKTISRAVRMFDCGCVCLNVNECVKYLHTIFSSIQFHLFPRKEVLLLLLTSVSANWMHGIEYLL